MRPVLLPLPFATRAYDVRALLSPGACDFQPLKTTEIHRRPEVPLIDYQSQQYRLFPALATAYAYFLCGNQMFRIYTEATEQLQSGKLDLLPEVCL